MADDSKEYSRYEQAVEDAKKKNCVIVVPGIRELFVDLDTQEAIQAFHVGIRRLAEIEAEVRYIVRPSPSGAKNRQHAVVTLSRDLRDNEERIMFQALLGSDLTREFLSYLRFRRGDPVPTLFFEVKDGPYDPGALKKTPEDDNDIGF